MINPKTTHAILHVVFCSLLFFTTQAQNQQTTSYDIITGATTGLIKPKGDYEISNANIYGAMLGFSTEKSFLNNSFIWFCLSYNYLNISNYKNEIDYTSNWSNGPETEKISLETELKHQYIEAQFFVRKKQKHTSIGAGFIVSYLMNTQFNQRLVGNYPPPAQYPLATESYNSSLKYVLEQSNNYTSPFHRVNIAPAFNIGYRINSIMGIEGVVSYEVIQNPKYFEVLFNPYRTLKTSLILTFKLK
ncbi:MAG: hypothetical protein V4651_12375 [Bacteroidota bacterium]